GSLQPAPSRQVSGRDRRADVLNNTISADRWGPAVKAVLDRYPLPNVFTATGQEAAANNYIRTANETTNQDQFGIRLDHTLNSRPRLFGGNRYFRDDPPPSTPLPDGSGSITAGVIGKTLTRADSVALEHNWTVSGNKVNQLRFGYTRRGFNRTSLQTGQPASQASGIPNLPAPSFLELFP